MTNYRFLVVDDSPFSCMALKQLLEDKGHKVVGEAHDAARAVALFKETSPDIITLDINMPRKTGIDAMREIFSQNAAARFLIVTAVSQKMVLDQCKALGRCAYVPKPVQWEKLEAAIAEITK